MNVFHSKMPTAWFAWLQFMVFSQSMHKTSKLEKSIFCCSILIIRLKLKAIVTWWENGLEIQHDAWMKFEEFEFFAFIAIRINWSALGFCAIECECYVRTIFDAFVVVDCNALKKWPTRACFRIVFMLNNLIIHHDWSVSTCI